MKKFTHSACLLSFYLVMAPAIVSPQTNSTNLLNADTRAADSLYFAGQWKLAIPAYESILAKNPGSSLCLNRLGFSYQNTSQFEKALKSYRNSLSHHPPSQLKMVVQSRIARVYALLGDKAQAFLWLDSSVSNGYSNLLELDSLDDYNSLRQDSQFKNLVCCRLQNRLSMYVRSKFEAVRFLVGRMECLSEWQCKYHSRQKQGCDRFGRLYDPGKLDFISRIS